MPYQTGKQRQPRWPTARRNDSITDRRGLLVSEPVKQPAKTGWQACPHRVIIPHQPASPGSSPTPTERRRQYPATANTRYPAERQENPRPSSCPLRYPATHSGRSRHTPWIWLTHTPPARNGPCFPIPKPRPAKTCKTPPTASASRRTSTRYGATGPAPTPAIRPPKQPPARRQLDAASSASTIRKPILAIGRRPRFPTGRLLQRLVHLHEKVITIALPHDISVPSIIWSRRIANGTTLGANEISSERPPPVKTGRASAVLCLNVVNTTQLGQASVVQTVNRHQTLLVERSFEETASRLGPPVALVENGPPQTLVRADLRRHTHINHRPTGANAQASPTHASHRR